jgi:Mn2+/Fe2+ NRAMP family transporter
VLQLLLFTSSVDVMGEKFVNSTFTTIATSSVAFLVVGINGWGVFEAVVTQV